MAEALEPRQAPHLLAAEEASPSHERRITATLALEGMTCASCALRIEKGLKKVPGVADASVNLASERATVQYDPSAASVDALLRKVDAVGYRAAPITERPAAATRVTGVAPTATAGSSSGSRSNEPTVELEISGMTCASCARRVERSLAKAPGVTSAHVNLATE